MEAAVEMNFPEMVRVRRHLHAFPEPSGEEFDTTRFLLQTLTDAGFHPQPVPENRGVMVTVADEPGAPTIAIRADIDALRIQEAGQAEYRSRRPGVMHACGHDGHTAVVLGALLALRTVREALPRPLNWRAIFQPAEETSEGAPQMIAAGALDGVDAILSLHMDPSRLVGRVGVRYGALTAACDALEIRVSGRGGHAARPHESLDPIAAAAQLISSIYLFLPRARDSHEPVVVTIGEVSAGHNPNVIPELATLRGTIRSLGEAERARTKDHIRQLARGIAEVSGTKIEVHFTPGPQSVVNNATLTDLLRDAAGEVLGAASVDVIERASMGGEDFAFYLEQVPGAMFRLGCASPNTAGAPLHSPCFDLDERSLAVGANVLARAVARASEPERWGKTR
jgi:amidohydrolase